MQDGWIVGYRALHDSRATQFRDAGSLISVYLSIYLSISIAQARLAVQLRLQLKRARDSATS